MTRLSQKELARLGINEPSDHHQSKYRNQPSTFNGITFDSQAELDYYLYLLALQQSGEVMSIRLQPRYTLQEAFHKHGKLIRAIEYVADFEVEYADGRVEVVDVKGARTKDYQIKRKLFEHRYPDLSIREVGLDEIMRSR